MAFSRAFQGKPYPVVFVAVLSCPLLCAQTVTTSLPGVTVSAKAAPVLDAGAASVGLFTEAVAQTPQSISVLTGDLLAARGATTLSQVIALDASLADSYNTTGYIENLSVRGFVLDQSANTLRNGLPVSAYAPLALEGVERIEVLKGISGLQSGVSAPGGLVNFVSKLPGKEAFTVLDLSVDDRGGSTVHVDANVPGQALALRVNLVQDTLRPAFDRADGMRQVLSLAAVARPQPGTTVTAILEAQRKSQPSVPGLGLLDTNGDGVGDTLPPLPSPRLNLNSQSWSQPFEYAGTLAQLIWQQQLGPGWSAEAGFSAQRSTIQDRLAFPDGCSSAVTYVYPGLCANGDVDLYDYRSEGEVRTSQSWNASVKGTFAAWGQQHGLRLGLAGRDNRTELAPLQAYNFVGTTNIFQPGVFAPDATLSAPNTNSSEHTAEAFAALSTRWEGGWQTFAGARTTQLSRSSVRSDGLESLSLAQTVTTPWAGASWQSQPGLHWYASWGQGVELESVPNRPLQFANAGAVLPAGRSDQVEAGIKWQALERLLVTGAVFRIDKPYADDVASPGGLLLRVGGARQVRHQGLELGLSGAAGPNWSWHGSALLLDAQFVRAVNPALVGQSPTNIPRRKVSLFTDYKFNALPGLSAHGLLVAESGKTATLDGAVVLPDAWQVDAGVQYRQRLSGVAAVWRLQVTNLADRVSWREAPTQSWGGTYLFTSAPRAVRAGLSLEF